MADDAPRRRVYPGKPYTVDGFAVVVAPPPYRRFSGGADMNKTKDPAQRPGDGARAFDTIHTDYSTQGKELTI